MAKAQADLTATDPVTVDTTQQPPLLSDDEQDRELAALRELFVRRVHSRLLSTEFARLLRSITVRDIAPGAMHKEFRRAFPEGHGFDPPATERGAAAVPAPGTLAAYLKQHATRRSDVSPAIEVELMQLINALRDRRSGVGDDFRSLAFAEFTAYSTHADQVADELVRNLMIAVARFDKDAQEQLQARYQMTDDGYAAQYKELLDAAGRVPNPKIVESHEELAVVIACVLDGFLARAAIEGENGEFVGELFKRIIVPLLGALTYRHGGVAPTDENWLYGDAVPGATRMFRRTRPDAAALAPADMGELSGTWIGTTYRTSVPPSGAKVTEGKEIYLAIDVSGDAPTATCWTDDGTHRMIFPAFSMVGDVVRLSCLYETDLIGNANPDMPSLRGAFILEGSTAGHGGLEGRFFTDRSTRGFSKFVDRKPSVASSFLDARDLWTEDWTPTPPDLFTTYEDES